MMWLLLSLLNAFFESMKGVFSKKGLAKMDEYVMAWSMRFFSLVITIPLLLFFGIPDIGSLFLPFLVLNSMMQVFTTVLFMKAIKHSDLSIVSPMITFTPLFLLISSPLMLGEFPSTFGILGIVLIVLGSYMLNLKERHHGLMAPFRALMSEKGPRYMLIVAVLFSITANIDKVGVLDSSPVMWVVAVNLLTAALLTPMMLARKGRDFKKSLPYLVPVGIISGLSLMFQMTAITMTLVPYAISVKRTSVIMSVLFGGIIFKEKGVRERLLGAVIMVLGVILITLG